MYFALIIGGYSPVPSNDLWITTDGVVWVYCGLAPWSARAWHSTLVFNNTLYLYGGSPLNNEVWRLDNITKVDRIEPLTRATFEDYTYKLDWTYLGEVS